MNGDESTLPAAAAARCRGEGVRGIRPPAVREEKSPVWDLIGVDTDTEAIVIEEAFVEEEEEMVSINRTRAPRDSS